MKALGVFFLIGYTASAGVAHAATYYVSKSGSNNNTCAQAQSTSTPKLTIAGGLSCMVAGDTLLVRAGTYAEGMVNNIPSGTSWSNKVRIANYNGETVWLTGQITDGLPFGIFLNNGQRYIEIEGIKINGYVALNEAPGLTHHIRLQNLEISNHRAGATGGTVYGGGDDLEFLNLDIHGEGGPIGIYIKGNRILIDGCDLHAVSGTGIQVRDTASDNIIRNNRIHDMTQSEFFYAKDGRIRGITVGDGADNTLVYNNLIHDIDLQNGLPLTDNSAGIIVWRATNSRIWNNTITRVKNHGIWVFDNFGSTEIKNNIVYGTAGDLYKVGGSNPGLTVANNLFGVDPLFVDSRNNFQLRAGSPAIDRGAGIPVVAADIAKVARPQGSTHDIGAYESPAGQQASGPPAPPTGVRIVN